MSEERQQRLDQDLRHASEKPEYYTFNTVKPQGGEPGTEGV